MPECICLRDCFVNGIYYVAGGIYEVPTLEGMSPKNFRSVDGLPIVEAKVEIKQEDKVLIVLREVSGGKKTETEIAVF